MITAAIGVYVLLVLALLAAIHRMIEKRTMYAALVDDWHRSLEGNARDGALADWTRNTKITVCTVTGTWVSMTLAELARSPVPYRCWNVPTSVEFHPASIDIDREQAKEHRG